jgi:sugar phosphate isomerase/epimerase
MQMASIGVQLYTVRDHTAKDFLGTIRKIAQIGYEGVEFAGYFGTDAGDLKKVLVDSGLEPGGSVLPLPDLLDEKKRNDFLDYAYKIECSQIICPILPEGYRGTAEDFRRAADILNDLGNHCSRRGLRFYYHIHGVEFARFDEGTGLEILLQSTDSAVVSFQADVGWIHHAGVDPVDFLQKYGSRCPLLHLKDLSVAKMDTEVGTGVVDIAGCIREALRYKASWLTVEQESFTIPSLESVAISCRNVIRMKGEIEAQER